MWKEVSPLYTSMLPACTLYVTFHFPIIIQLQPYNVFPVPSQRRSVRV